MVLLEELFTVLETAELSYSVLAHIGLVSPGSLNEGLLYYHEKDAFSEEGRWTLRKFHFILIEPTSTNINNYGCFLNIIIICLKKY